MASSVDAGGVSPAFSSPPVDFSSVTPGALPRPPNTNPRIAAAVAAGASRERASALRCLVACQPSDIWPLQHTNRIIGWLEGRPYALCGDNERLDTIGTELGIASRDLLLINGSRFPRWE